MKSFVFAALASAVAVAAHADNERRLLGLDKINLGVDVKLPAGIEISAELGPKTPPPADCTNVWHPSHPNGDMDGCDNHGADGWHWVHPCEVCQPQAHSWTTSTITETCLSTVIACPPSVTNCPGSTTIQTTITIPATTTICPVEQTQPPAQQTTVVAPPPSTGEELPPCPTDEQPPAGQQPPAGEQPPAGQQPPAGEQPPATTQPPVVVAPPPAGGNNTWTQPPVVAGASSVKAIGGAAVFGVVAAILL